MKRALHLVVDYIECKLHPYYITPIVLHPYLSKGLGFGLVYLAVNCTHIMNWLTGRDKQCVSH